MTWSQMDDFDFPAHLGGSKISEEWDILRKEALSLLELVWKYSGTRVTHVFLCTLYYILGNVNGYNKEAKNLGAKIRQ